jgi:hypothetical protein
MRLVFIGLLLSAAVGCISSDELETAATAAQGEALLRYSSILCLNGKYASAENGGGGAVYCNRTAVGDWEKFTIVDLGSNVYAIRSFNGLYLSAINGGGGDVEARAEGVGSWEEWKLGGGGVVGFGAPDGTHYLSANLSGDGRLHARATEFTDSETFVLSAL